MSVSRLTVVLSQAQGKNPTRRALEESIAAALILEPGLDVSIVPYLYDLGPDHTGRLFLESVQGDMVVLGWMYPRAAFWLLDRDGIKGQEGVSQIAPRETPDEEEDAAELPKGIGAVETPDRHIYCLDLRDKNDHRIYVDEVKRIALECRQRREASLKQWIGGQPSMVQLGRYLGQDEPVALAPAPAFSPEKLLEQPGRRWYPVIDYSRCTNCMECLDFCLFGVYGVDKLDRILVESQDNCKRGCPACSRVCPEQAIMFPDYKTPAIAGAAVGAVSGLKIDLSKLFGGGDAMTMAARERDTELVRDGREAVGMTLGIPKRQEGKTGQPKDDLDRLMDDLDALEI
jgi:NAD-dependent dihydropyrimidine dehydrogenase PreA subunit